MADLEKMVEEENAKNFSHKTKEVKKKKIAKPKAKKEKKKYKVVLASKKYVVYDFNGHNAWTAKFTDKDVSVGDEISL